MWTYATKKVRNEFLSWEVILFSSVQACYWVWRVYSTYRKGSYAPKNSRDGDARGVCKAMEPGEGVICMFASFLLMNLISRNIIQETSI